MNAVHQDTNMKERVELHCHTDVSEKDGVSDIGDLIEKAVAFEQRALAITDHGTV